LTTPLGFPDALQAYARLVRWLTEQKAFIAPIGELVAWRRARRHARAIGMRSDGSIDVDFPTAIPNGMSLALEDERGNVVQTTSPRR